ncbi:MAG: DNA gyrase inhibitor YacG [Rhizobiales bacterium]|nr:DNA gyrase inhibitor YacG [Hyphomicrobiales bacterium]
MAQKAPRCPICDRAANPKEQPFCSPRCRDVDLNRWLTGAYAIPAEPASDAQTDLDESAANGAGNNHNS